MVSGSAVWRSGACRERATMEMAYHFGGKHAKFPANVFGTVPAVSMDENALGTLVLARGGIMLYYALVFLVVALIAGALGVSGVAAVATNIAYVLFVIAIVLFLVHLLTGRRRLTP